MADRYVQRWMQHVGKTYGALRVIDVGPVIRGQRVLTCACACGIRKSLDGANVLAGRTRSCGCKRLTWIGDGTSTHGHTRGGKRRPEYEAWKHMLRRCLSPADSRYADYGGRGISVCLEWVASYEAFYAHVGQRPSATHSLDRIDVNGNYEPGNVRWATRAEQLRNTRSNRHITAFGTTKTLAEWADITGVRRSTIAWRIDRRNMTPEEAMHDRTTAA